MGFKNNFIRGCAVLLASLAVITCLNACKDKPVDPTPTEIVYEISDSSMDTTAAYSTLKNKLISSYSDLDGMEDAIWNDLSIVCIQQDEDEFRDLSITAAVPLNDEDYTYCLIKAEHNGDSYEHDDKCGLDGLNTLYPCITQNKENTITYYSGDNFASIAENFEEDDYSVTTQIIDQSYYILSDSIIDMISQACDDENLQRSDFFKGQDVTSYLSYVDNNEVHIYNVETMDKVKLVYSEKFKSFQESYPYLTYGEYSKFTKEQLKELGYTFTPADLIGLTKKK